MIPRDKLIEQLAEEASSSQDVAQDPTLAQLKAELETVESRVRQPAPVDPVVDESECQATVGRIIELGRDISAATRDAMNQQPSVSATSPLGVLGQYQLLEKLGEGGMGAVYKAVHSRLERVVAVKVLPANRMQDAQAVGRFQREMRAVGKLQHPNIVAAHDAGEIDGTHYLVMELVEGIDLGKLVSRMGPLPIDAACELVRQAAFGLQHAYEHNLVHRDIKPSNLMLAVPSNSKSLPTVKILDLGLALLEGSHVEANELTSTGQVMGTIDYMAPEQGTDTHGVDIRADIYSLGATLYKLLSGQAPFADPQYSTPIKKLMALATKTPRPIESLRPDCPPELASLVTRMLAKSPEDRPTPPEELASLLEPFARAANLRELLTANDGTHTRTTPRQDSVIQTHLTADEPTFLTANNSLSAHRITTEQTIPPRSRPRFWLAGGGACVLVLSAIIAISVNKGEGTIEIDAPDDLVGQVQVNVVREGREFKYGWQLRPGAGNKLTIRSGNVDVTLPDDNNEYELTRPDELVVRRGKTVVFTLRRKGAQAPVYVAGNEKPNVSAPVATEAPPPLDEWLKGRAILTVAQDGSAQFTTIQEALNALKSHEVVKVLDAGPYRGKIISAGLPPDTGLISAHQTVLEVGETTAQFGPFDGFRISGFRVLGSPLNDYAGLLLINRASGVVLEDCYFALTQRTPESRRPAVDFVDVDPDSKPSFIRNCVFDNEATGVTLNGNGSLPDLFVERNCFKRTGLGMAFSGPRLGTLVVRHNVFDSPHGVMWVGNLQKIDGRLEISNNTTKTNNFCSLDTSAPPKGIVVYNNISEITPCHIDPKADLSPESALKNWDMDYNCYVRRGRLSKADHDVIADPQFLSSRVDDREYLHIPADTPLAGAGGKWPAYIGAFPPGPAPTGGDWFTRIRDRWMKGADASKPIEGGDQPLALVEPPPLDEWLKGRTILTVAQDGSGQFGTIQEALLALQSGEVVQVLDRGPYRERLERVDLPIDCGLISTVQTIVEAPDWKYLWDTDDGEGGKEPRYGAHRLSNADSFRLHGFDLRFAPHSQKAVHRLTVGGTRDFLVENCALRAHQGRRGDTVEIGNLGDKLSSGMRVTIRNCLIEGTVVITGFEGRSEAVVERNEFVSSKNHHYLVFDGPNLPRIRLRQNVFCSDPATIEDVVFAKSKRCEFLEVTNNTFGGEHSLVFSGSLPQKGVSIRNNLQSRSGLLLSTTNGAEQQQPLIAAHWNVDHNAARRIPEGVSSIAVPLQPGDIDKTPHLLSKDPQSPDYLRIAADDPLANSGKGGSWPNYIGALRPGPTPKDGDWFTRLRERWEGAKSTSHTFVKEPLAITDPPPLDEWLKGRTILTVAQDGSGKFKTIQAALNVVQPGNVIKVLDKGPYRERLHRSDIPPDTGLVTEVGTEIETPDRGEYVDGGGGRYLAGHIFEGAREFRVSGFTWVPLPKTYSDPPVPNVDVRFAFPHGLVFEQCLFRGRSPIAELQVMIWSDLGICCVRECRFEGTLAFSEGQNVLVTRNEFDFPGPYAAISVGSANQRPRKLAIRHNIFRGQKNQVILVGDLGRGLEISNNTFQNPFPIVVFNPVLGAEVSICNNIHFGKGLLVFEQNGDLLRAGTEWNIRSNCLAAELVPGVYGWNASQIFPKSQADMIGEPQQLSFNQENPHFSRIAANDPIVQKGVGGAWPGYLGALPPGPAPKEGDWFTRLCERCNASRPTLSKTTHEPMPITQPPSLDDWLKGRTILTVAQDGSGQFKTIQEALNAMQSGEAVQVLDRGPYLEQLDLKCPPDCGLISKVRTVIAPPKAILTGDGRSVGHYFRRTNGFRLHGFAFRLPEIKDQLGLVFDDRPGGVVIEQCQFRASHLATMSDGCAAVYLHSGPKGISKPTIIRNCRFDGRLMINGEDNMDDRDVLVLRNYFTGYDSELTPLALIHGFRSLEVRENVIKGSTVSFSTLEGSHAIDVIRNTFVGDINLSVFGSMPERMRFEGNLVCDYGKISVAADLPTERIKAWELKQNYFQGELGDWPETIRVPLGPTDKVAPIRFLSKIPSNHDYLRLAKDEKAVPPGVGALAQGSAPEEGDWFSRLQENWFDTESNSQ